MARQKQWRILFTFHTTTQAMKMEACATQRQKAGRLIPIPGEISAGCGLAWMAPLSQKEDLKEFLLGEHIETEGEYELFM
ncbi:MAG: DUF3343 domain-containing protein [bacterium]|nr:DUF3343 domain-containing protein [bacterium]